ncbi:MAG TPA: hypothetical protein VFG33_18575 [Kribbella sp.]|uniref:hypothetical protein n=1 Tax=Kribbella sp. TaxID=1871183 RepID=UPI002D774819|nr:hypothetical protein [Kribbella sp.]HET6295398.1 hypothetical protein [Kribbella sp.]
MSRIRWVLAWVFVRGPAALYQLGESGSWIFTPILLAGMALTAGAGAGVGALAGVLAGTPVSDASFNGVMIGLGTAIGWLVMSLLVIGILWIRGISPTEAFAGSQQEPQQDPQQEPQQEPHGRHAGKPAAGGWRRRGEPLVPGSLVGFFALIAVIFGFLAANAWHDSQPWDEPTAVVDGVVVEVDGPGAIERGSGKALVRYSDDHTIEISRDPDDEHFLQLRDVLPVEYAVARPGRARAVWAVESARGDLTLWGLLAGTCAVLAVASGVGYVVGRRRR